MKTPFINQFMKTILHLSISWQCYQLGTCDLTEPANLFEKLASCEISRKALLVNLVACIGSWKTFKYQKLGTLIVAKVNVDVDGARWKNMMEVAWPLQAKMSQIQLSRHVNRSIVCLNRKGNPQLPFLAVNRQLLKFKIVFYFKQIDRPMRSLFGSKLRYSE